MNQNAILSGAIVLVSYLPLNAQSYTGSFSTTNDQGGQTMVTLVQSGERVTGAMSGLGNTFQIDGRLEDGTLVGTLTMGQDGELWFEAEVDDTDLYLTLVASTPDGQLDFDSATMLIFTREQPNLTDGMGKTAGIDVVLAQW